MKQKLLTLMTLLLCAVSGAWATTTWTFRASDIKSGASFAPKGKNVFVANDGLELTYKGNSDSDALVESSATIGGTTYASYLNLNGATSSGRYMYVEGISGKGTLSIVFASGKKNNKAITINDNAYNGTVITTINSAEATLDGTKQDIEITTSLAADHKYYINGHRSIYAVIWTPAPTDPKITVAPTSADPFTYVVGNGPSTAQTFTATLSNQTSDDITVSLQAGSSYYEISDDGSTYGTSNLTIGSGDAVYVRLKSGLSKETYDGTLRFANEGADNVDIALSGSVTNQTYTVTYELNGASGDAPTQVPQEDGAVFALAAAPSRDCYTFDGWLCDIDGVTYAAGADYTMTAAATTFTAQWTAVYASSIDFAAIVEAGTTASNPIATFMSASNIFASNLGSSAWETETGKSGFIGYKLKNSGATVKFLLKAGKAAKITLGSVGNDATLKKGEVSTTITKKKGDDAETIVPTIYAADDMVVSLITSSDQTVTLKKIDIYDSEEVAIELPCVGGLGTFYHGSKDLDFSSCSAKAYVVTAITSSAVTLTEVTNVAKGYGIIVKGASQGETVKALTLTMTSDEVTAFEALGNKLYAGPTTVGSDGQWYGLSKTDGKFHPLKKGVAIPAGKAYLKGSDIPAGANFLSLDFGEGSEATGIEAVESKKMVNNNVFYNLAGQQVAQPTKGLYIVNGKKVIIK